MKKIIVYAASLIMFVMLISPSPCTLMAQGITVDTGVNLNSRFIYRGAELGTSPHVQAMIGFKAGNLSLYGWGSHSMGQDDQSYKEVKFWLNYTIDLGDFKLTPQIENHFNAFADFLDFDDATTTHVLQASARLAGTSGDIRPDLMLGYAFWGPIENTIYIEAGVNFSVEEYGLRAFLSTQYSEAGGFVDLGYGGDFVMNQIGISGSRTLKVTDTFSMPLGVSLILNPKTERIFTSVTVGF
jgi:hypothetical protein